MHRPRFANFKVKQGSNPGGLTGRLRLSEAKVANEQLTAKMGGNIQLIDQKTTKKTNGIQTKLCRDESGRG